MDTRVQSLTWYIRRLKVMTPAEVAWRLKACLREGVDRALLARRQRPRARMSLLLPGATGDECGFRVTDMAVGEWAAVDENVPERHWLDRLRSEADDIAAGRFTFFDLRSWNLGDPIDWHRDHKSGRSAPRIHSSSIDYRDFTQVGDAKFVWETNRHHQFVVLGRAYRGSGESVYASALVEQLDAWMTDNPYGLGMNWRSPLELAVRMINWVWALDMIRESGLFRGTFRDRVLDCVQRHLWEIRRKYSRGSSANNHRIGEAAGVFIAASYFHRLKQAERWRDESRDILCREIVEQTHPDGGNREQAFGYHLFVMQFFLYCGLVGRWTGIDFPSRYWTLLERMFEFTEAIAQAGPPHMYGDRDDGTVLNLGYGSDDVHTLLGVGALLFERPDLKSTAGGCAEAIRWLFGRTAQERFSALPVPPDACRLRSKAFRDTGYYLLQSGSARETDAISVGFDCAVLGFRSIAAHGHADALSFTLRVRGVDVIVDPGTYDYFTYPDWRDYFRSTRAHNVLTVDEQDQSVMLGPFMWGHRANVRCIRWDPGESGGMVCGEHDGYRRLRDPVTHRRTISLESTARRIVVRDDITAKGRHEISLHLHLAEQCRLVGQEGEWYVVDYGPSTVRIRQDPALMVTTARGSEDPIVGWVSRGYHQKNESLTFLGRCVMHGSGSLHTEIALSP